MIIEDSAPLIIRKHRGLGYVSGEHVFIGYGYETPLSLVLESYYKYGIATECNGD